MITHENELKRLKSRILSRESPSIITLSNQLTEEQIKELENTGRSKIHPAKVISQQKYGRVATGKMKVDKGYNQIRKLQRIQEAESLRRALCNQK